MNKEQFLEKITAIGSCEDDVERRTMLTELSDDVSLVFDSNETLSTQNTTFAEENEKLRAANMKLFLRVGEQKEPEDLKPTEPPQQKRSFKNLFNEKGEIL